MPSFVLTDLARGLWIDSIAITPATVGLSVDHPWAVHKQALRGGRRDGVDLVLVQNGALSFSVIPTRGMGLWKAQHKGLFIGWDSPVADGPVNPAFVNLAAGGGIGWLDGFDELMVRCGLEHNGAPYREGDAIYPLHGRIANLPAHYLAVHIGESPPHTVTVEGCVDEARLFGPKLRMTSSVTTVIGSNQLTVRDEFANLGDLPADLQILYHWNLGPPHLGEGARFVAPVRTVVPRDARAAENITSYEQYGPPTPGFTEQAYYFELVGEGPEARTVTLLRAPAGDRGVALRFATSRLPAFTLWKNSGGLKDGYVTGLEPATNYPNPKPFEKARGRVISLAPGASHVAETTFEVLHGNDAVATVEAEIAALQRQASPVIHQRPTEPYAAKT